MTDEDVVANEIARDVEQEWEGLPSGLGEPIVLTFTARRFAAVLTDMSTELRTIRLVSQEFLHIVKGMTTRFESQLERPFSERAAVVVTTSVVLPALLIAVVQAIGAPWRLAVVAGIVPAVLTNIVGPMIIRKSFEQMTAALEAQRVYYTKQHTAMEADRAYLADLYERTEKLLAQESVRDGK